MPPKSYGSGERTTDNTPAKPPSPSPSPSIYILPLLSVVISFFIGVAIWHSYKDIQSDLGPWGCRMSWMSPNYIRKDGPRAEGMGGLENKYSLWLYREGGLQGHIKPEGQPVLFIPGNAGSSRQARSIASSTAHQYYNSRHQADDGNNAVVLRKYWKEIDLFTVDFNEEFSAFHAGTIHDQAHYVAHSIRYILSLYNQSDSTSSPRLRPQPTQILLLGHSMGGIVSTLSLTLVQSGFDKPEDDISKMVAGIITMSTPHMMPPVTFDWGMEKIYGEIERYWRCRRDQAGAGGGEPELPVLVSLCGGTADTQISSDACALPSYLPQTGIAISEKARQDDPGTFAVFTTGIEGIWTGADHQAIVWCDQIRAKVATTVLDMHAVMSSDELLGQGSRRKRLTAVARRNFLAERTEAQLRPQGESHTPGRSPVRVSATQPVIHHKGGKADYVVACPAGNACHLQILGTFTFRGIGPYHSPHIEIYATSSTSDSASFSHLAAVESIDLLPRSSYSSAVDESFPLPGEGVKRDEGYTSVELAAAEAAEVLIRVEDAVTFVVGFAGKEAVSGEWKPIKRTFVFPHALDHSLLAHEVKLHRKQSTECTGHFAPILQQISHQGKALAHTYESRMIPLTSSQQSLRIHSHISASPFISEGSDHGITLALYQSTDDPCWIDRVEIKTDWAAVSGLLVLRQRMSILAWVIGVSLSIWRTQVSIFRKTGEYPSYFLAASHFVKRDSHKLAAILLVGGAAQASPLRHLIPYSGRLLLGTTNLSLVPLSVVILAATIGICILGHLIPVLLTRTIGLILARASGPVSDRAISRKRVATITLSLVLVSYVIPQQFVFVVLFLLQTGNVADLLPPTKAMYASIIDFMFWLVPLNAPTILVWVRGCILDWRQTFAFGAGWGVVNIVGWIFLIQCCSTQRALHLSSRRMQLIDGAITCVAIVSFTIGPRYTHVISTSSNVLALAIAIILYT